MSVKPLGDNRFMVRVYNPHGREYRRVVHGRRAADAHEADMKAKLTSGRLLDPHGGKVTFRTYARQQLATRNLRPSTAARYERALAQHIEPVFGHRPLQGIRYSDVAAFQTAMMRRFGDKHARDIIVLVRSILRAAALDGLIERNPAAGLRLEPIRPTERPELTWADVRAAYDVAPRGTDVAIALLAMTGLRASEACGLEPGDLHALRREVTVRQQLLRGPQGAYTGPPKTPESARTVPVPQALVDVLAAHLAARPGTYVLGGTVGDSLANRVRAAGRKAGVQLAPHAMRHLYTNTLLEAGVPLRTVDYVTGHRSAGITIGVYARVTPEALDRARQAVAEAWAAAGRPAEQPGSAAQPGR